MQVLRNVSEISAFITTNPDPNLTTLINQRLEELISDDDQRMEDHVFFVIPEADDTLADLEVAIGSAIQTDDGHPLWEVIERHPSCFEMVFVLESSGYGALVLVPDPGANPELLNLCRTYATLMTEWPTP